MSLSLNLYFLLKNFNANINNLWSVYIGTSTPHSLAALHTCASWGASMKTQLRLKNTAAYTMDGDTLKLYHFIKLIDAQGKDITEQMPKDVWDTRTRLK